MSTIFPQVYVPNIQYNQIISVHIAFFAAAAAGIASGGPSGKHLLLFQTSVHHLLVYLGFTCCGAYAAHSKTWSVQGPTYVYTWEWFEPSHACAHKCDDALCTHVHDHAHKCIVHVSSITRTLASRHKRDHAHTSMYTSGQSLLHVSTQTSTTMPTRACTHKQDACTHKQDHTLTCMYT